MRVHLVLLSGFFLLSGSMTLGSASPVFAEAMFMGLGDLPGGSFGSAANGVSADGSVVVGGSNSAAGDEAFRWTSDGGMVGLDAIEPGAPWDRTGSAIRSQELQTAP